MDPLEIKTGPPLEGPVLVPFWPLHCGKSVEAAKFQVEADLTSNSCGWNLELGSPIFARLLFLRFEDQKRASSLSYCFAPISIALRPSRPASKPALH